MLPSSSFQEVPLSLAPPLKSVKVSPAPEVQVPFKLLPLLWNSEGGSLCGSLRVSASLSPQALQEGAFPVSKLRGMGRGGSFLCRGAPAEDPHVGL